MKLEKHSLVDKSKILFHENLTINHFRTNGFHIPIAPRIEQLEIQVFIGTWCRDTQRELPRFIKVLEESGFTQNQIKIIALDNKAENYKRSPGEEQDGKSIFRVPTFVIYENGKELNRIVEFPVISLEIDYPEKLFKKSRNLFNLLS